MLATKFASSSSAHTIHAPRARVNHRREAASVDGREDRGCGCVSGGASIGVLLVYHCDREKISTTQVQVSSTPIVPPMGGFLSPSIKSVLFVRLENVTASVTNGQISHTLNQGILERGEAPPIGLPDTDQALDGILFWRRNLLARDLWSAMQMHQRDVVAKEADVLYEAFESAALKTRLKEPLMRGCNGLAPLEVDSIPDNIISIFCEGGSVGLPITLVPPILVLLKEIVQCFLISTSVIGVVHRVSFSLSVSVL